MLGPCSAPSWYLLTRLLNSCCHASPIPHTLPIASHMPWLSHPTCPGCRVPHALAVASHAPWCRASPVTSHTPPLSAHGVEPSVCGPLPYPLSSLEPPCPARGECQLILSSAAAANIQPLVAHSFAPPHPPRTPLHVSSGLLQEGTCKSPIVLLDDDNKLLLPKRRLSPGHGAPDNDKPKKRHRVTQLQPFHALVAFQLPEPHGGPGSDNTVLCCAPGSLTVAGEMVNGFCDGGRCVVSLEVSHVTSSARWY